MGTGLYLGIKQPECGTGNPPLQLEPMLMKE